MQKSQNLGTPVTSGNQAAPASHQALLRAGSTLEVRLLSAVDSSQLHAGSRVEGRLVGELRAPNGQIVVPSGAPVTLTVVDRNQAGRMIGHSATALGVDGRSVAIDTDIFAMEAKRSETRNTARRTLIGAGIGAIANDDHREGARKGALVGLGASLLTKGEAARIPAGTTLRFRLSRDVTVR
ncbi:hypothetical protein [Hydrogenimonas sp.]